MPSPTSRPLVSLSRWLACVVFAAVVLQPSAAMAQGFPGGMPGGIGGMGGRGGYRGGRGSRGAESRDSIGAARRESSGTLADLALRHRSELQLTDSQATVIAYAARQARTDRASAMETLAALRDTTGESRNVAPQTDSTRIALLQHRRAVAGALAQLHDVDVNARTATLAALSPTQQNTLVKLETAEGASAAARPSRSEGGEGGGSPPGNS